ncbi:ribosomal protein S5 domain 2-type protein [Hyaloraphidium curvatum]|nr:ribosomal protein S5 domain 2-type protein [Hyaloraphidium curvatum]
MISRAEADYIVTGVERNIRGDGRKRTDYRRFQVETGVVAQASGSCRLRLDGTDVLVGIKVEVGSIVPERADDEEEEQDEEAADDAVAGERTAEAMPEGLSENRGRVVCSVECSPGVASDFTGAEGGENALTIYSQIMNKVFNGPQAGIDLESLVIISRQQCWILYIDALILEYNGNVLDCIFLAVRGALRNTRIPKTVVEEVAEGQFDFDVVDGTVPVKGAEDVPVTVTLNKLGKRYIIDPNPLEELSSSAKVTVAVNSRGSICAIQKGGKGGIDPSLLSEMIQSARTIGGALIKALDAGLRDEPQGHGGIGKELFK